MRPSVQIEVLTSPDCKPCEILLELLNRVLAEQSNQFARVEVKVVDVLSDPDSAVRYGVLSTPALAINGKLCFTGVPKKAELATRILKEVGAL